jgi:hypothetical protein
MARPRDTTFRGNVSASNQIDGRYSRNGTEALGWAARGARFAPQADVQQRDQ